MRLLKLLHTIKATKITHPVSQPSSFPGAPLPYRKIVCAQRALVLPFSSRTNRFFILPSPHLPATLCECYFYIPLNLHICFKGCLFFCIFPHTHIQRRESRDWCLYTALFAPTADAVLRLCGNFLFKCHRICYSRIQFMMLINRNGKVARRSITLHGGLMMMENCQEEALLTQRYCY